MAFRRLLQFTFSVLTKITFIRTSSWKCLLRTYDKIHYRGILTISKLRILSPGNAKKKVKYYKKSKHVKIRKSLMGSALILPAVIFKTHPESWLKNPLFHMHCAKWLGSLISLRASSLTEPACNHFVSKADVTVHFWFLLKSHNRAIFASIPNSKSDYLQKVHPKIG